MKGIPSPCLSLKDHRSLHSEPELSCPGHCFSLFLAPTAPPLNREPGECVHLACRLTPYAEALSIGSSGFLDGRLRLGEAEAVWVLRYITLDRSLVLARLFS